MDRINLAHPNTPALLAFFYLATFITGIILITNGFQAENHELIVKAVFLYSLQSPWPQHTMKIRLVIPTSTHQTKHGFLLQSLQ
jgi:hypothetical protein